MNLIKDKDKYYTIEPRIDGFGAQYQCYIWLILYCELHNLKFIKPKIENIEHNYNNDKNFIKKIEEFMNLQEYENIDKNNIEITTLSYFDIIKCFKYVEKNIDKCLESNTMQKLKNLFWINKKYNHIYFINDNVDNYFNIAVHIRRKNSNDNRDGDCLNISNEYYKNKIDEVCENYLFNKCLKKRKPIRIFIYSQGDEEEFKYLKDNKYGEVILKINDDIFQTFLGMVVADALILSASSFSYIAAFLSNGVIYYYPFWHNPSKKWFISQNVNYIGLGGYDNIFFD